MRELVEKRTQTSKHFLMSDGSYRAVISAAPVHYRGAAGAWTDIDTDLVPEAATGDYVTRAAPVKGRFGSQLTGKPVRVEGDGYSVGIDMIGATEDGKFVWGNKALYLGVANDTMLEYEALSDGVKETLVLASADAPSTFRFALTLDGLEVRQVRRGEWALFRPGSEKPELELGSLCVFDSSENAAGDPAYCSETTMTVTAVPGGATVSYEISKAWLSDPARVFPVRIDPTLSQTASIDTFLSSKYPTTNYGADNELKCGYYDSTTGHNRSLVKFDLSSITSSAYIDSATYSAYQFHTYYVNTPAITYLARVTSDWSESSTWSSLGCSVNHEGDIASGIGSQSPSGRNIWVNWTVTSTVQDWVKNTYPNYGFMMFQDEGDSGQMPECWRKFYSRHYATSSLRPKLVVNYSYPHHDVSQYVSTYRIGDTVHVQVHARTTYWNDVNDIRVRVNGAGGVQSRYRGSLRWTPTAPDPALWQSYAADGGYVSYEKDATYNSDRLTLIPAECDYGSNSTLGEESYKRFVFVFSVNDTWGDIQDNDFDTWSAMANGWNTGWIHNDTNVDILPKPIATLSHTTAPSASWFREVDRDLDGAADTPNDKRDAGRGSVALSWAASPLADGYRVYAFDGGSYQKVGETLSNTSTTWSSAGARLFPKDSEYATRAADSWTGNPFAAAAPLESSSREATIDNLAGGAGVVVTDGSSLYYRAWGSYAGPTKWTRIGTGLNGTSAGEPLGSVGPDFTSKRIYSAFYLDGVIYNGYALTPTTVEGVPAGAADGSPGTRTLSLTHALLDRTTGLALAGASANVIVAATDERIYSVSYNLTPGDTKDGFRIREYSREGTFTADHDIACVSFVVSGVIADGDNLYLAEWGSGGRIVKISTATTPWKVSNQFNTGWGVSSREINGCYDAANDAFWTGELDQGRIHRYAGLGLDLRDNPKSLYEKTDGEGSDANSNYEFRVVPYSELGELPVTDNAAAIPTLDNRTIRVNDDPRHTAHPLGDIMGHDAQVTLDESALELSLTDLAIASWGPVAALSRHYSSAKTSAGAFAPGWTFSFERKLVVNTNVADYFDEAGEAHRFTRDAASGVWAAPNGDYGALSQPGGVWRITAKDRSYTTFASDGRIASEVDPNGNATVYTWSGGGTHLQIRAANAQTIEVTLTSAGRVCTASYTTAAGTREVAYDGGAGYTPGLTHTVGHDGTAVGNKLDRYTYTSDLLRIQEVAEPRFVAAGPYTAVWSFVYDGSGRLSQVRWPGYASDNYRRSSVAYGSLAATVTSYATVDGAGPAAVEQSYAWNPTGTEAWHSNRRKAGTTALDTWAYTYNPQNETASQTSPELITTRTVYDSRGNAVYEFDGKGGMTANVYNAANELVRTTSPGGQTTYRTCDTATGNLLAEERVLTASGERARTEYTYDSCGRTLSERRRISATAWAQTDYDPASFAPNGEAQTVTERGAKLSPSGAAIDLTSTKSFDAFGNLVWEKNAKGEYVSLSNVYDIAGRLLQSTDASGVVTHHAYDVLGYESETSRTFGSSWADRTVTAHTPTGQVFEASSYDLVNGQAVIVRTDRHTFDASGDEITATTPEGTATTEHDAQGQVTAQVTPQASAPSEVGYDADGRVEASTAPAQTEADTYDYDANGQVIEEYPADSEPTMHTYDADGNETATVEPLEGPGTAMTATEYDVGGRAVKRTDEKEFVTTFTFDQLDRELTATTGGVSSTTAYNTLGWVLSKTDLDGVVTTYAYDEAGRVVSETLAGKVTTRTYDAAGRETSRTLPDSSSIVFHYDEFGRSDSETHWRAGQQLRSWLRRTDALGREVSATETVSGLVTARTWQGDSPSRIVRHVGSLATTVTLTAGVETALSASFSGVAVTASRSVAATDAAGRPTAYTLSAGTSRTQTATYTSDAGKPLGLDGAGLGAMGIDYAYSAETGRESVENIDLAYSGAAADRNRTFTYDAAGRLTAAADAGGASFTFAYSSDGKITASGTRSFAYDTSGPLQAMTVSGATTTYAYDSRGRRDLVTSPTEIVDLIYDDADRLTGFTRDLGKDGTIDVSATYTYDALGQRTRSVVTNAGVTTTTTWTYDGLELLSQTSVTGTSTTGVAYVNDPAGRTVGAYVTIPSISTVFVWIVTDARGDVLELLDKDGNPLSYRSYTPYGELLSTDAQAQQGGGLSAAQSAGVRDAISLRFAGFAYDAESGLYYCSARYYDPVTCQFIAKDPAGSDGEESAYQYCGGDPVGKTDPSGEWYQWVHKALSVDAANTIPAFSSWIGWRFDRASEIVGVGSAAVDKNPLTAPWNLSAWAYGHHFNTHLYVKDSKLSMKTATFARGRPDSRVDRSVSYFDKAARKFKQGYRRAAMTDLGYGAHALQDIYAHGNLAGHSLGHKRVSLKPDPDDPRTLTEYEKRNGWTTPHRANMAYMETRSYLLRFRQETRSYW